jgi:hypothetical protein
MAWANKLLGDVAVAEERFEDARDAYGAAMQVLAHHRCPIIEWKILRGAADVAKVLRDDDRAALFRARASATLDALGASIVEDRLRRQFLGSEAVRAALVR